MWWIKLSQILKIKLDILAQIVKQAHGLKSEVSYFKQGVISGLSASAKFGYDSELEIEIPKECEKYFYIEIRKSEPEYDEFLRLKDKFKNYK